MNKLRSTVLLFTAILAGAPLMPLSAQTPAPRPRASPHETISVVLGDRATGNRVTLVYGRPYSKSPKTGEVRKIWGGLIPWDKADRLGADEATLLITQKPLALGDAATVIPAGAYTLYLIPSETGPSKLAFSKAIGKWGVPVDETQDVARVELKKSSLDQPVDQLTLAIEKGAAGTETGTLKIMWETTQFALPIDSAK
jgi:hypothetical protein